MSSVLGALSSPLKKYITKILQSYLGKYIKDIQLDGNQRGPCRGRQISEEFRS